MHSSGTWISVILSTCYLENMDFERFEQGKLFVMWLQVNHTDWNSHGIIIDESVTRSGLLFYRETFTVGVLEFSLSYFLLEEYVCSVVSVVDVETGIIHILIINYAEVIWWNIFHGLWSKAKCIDIDFISFCTNFWTNIQIIFAYTSSRKEIFHSCAIKTIIPGIHRVLTSGTYASVPIAIADCAIKAICIIRTP